MQSNLALAADQDSGRPAGRRRRARWIPDGFVCVDDVVPTAPLSRASIYREVQSGRLPATRWRGRLLIRASVYAEWLAAVPSIPDADATQGTGP